MRILVTGSAGFIGTHLSHELRLHGHTVHGADIQAGNTWWQSQVDLRAAGSLPDGSYDACVHLAAKVGRLFGEDSLTETTLDNAAMTAEIAQQCGERGIRLVYASTSEVYGDRGEHECSEFSLYEDFGPHPHPHPPLPHNLYGLSKRWGEEACQLYAPDGLQILRLSMPYGPGLPAGRGRAAIVNMLYQALHGQPIPVHRGSERSWCWIGDTARAIRMVIESGQAGAFNVGRDDAAVPMTRVAEIACDLTGASESLIHEVDAPARQTVVKRLSTAKIRSLGWEPEVELWEGMERTLEWVKDTQEPPVAVAA